MFTNVAIGAGLLQDIAGLGLVSNPGLPQNSTLTLLPD